MRGVGRVGVGLGWGGSSCFGRVGGVGGRVLDAGFVAGRGGCRGFVVVVAGGGAMACATVVVVVVGRVVGGSSRGCWRRSRLVAGEGGVAGRKVVVAASIAVVVEVAVGVVVMRGRDEGSCMVVERNRLQREGVEGRLWSLGSRIVRPCLWCRGP